MPHFARSSDDERQLASYEREVAGNRVVIGLIAHLGCLIGFGLAHPLLSAFTAFNLTAAALLLFGHAIPLRAVRILTGLALDFGMAFWVMTFAPREMAVIYPLYLWVVLGVGFRFGLVWLGVASVCAAISFGMVIMTTAYWHASPGLSAALLVALIAIPAYCSRLIRQISEALARAETASRAKSRFLAGISHDLRTPLNAIIGYGTHLQSLKLEVEQRGMIAASVGAGRHLLYLIEQLLMISAQESDHVRQRDSVFTPIELAAAARDMVLPQARDKGLVVNLLCEAGAAQPLSGAADALRNMLVNLAGNAVKFTQSGGVLIRCGVQDGLLRFEVEDSGPGIAPGMEEVIFQPFRQGGDHIADQYGGTGLGLAISQRLLHSLDGRLDLVPTDHGGACFRALCPAVAAALPALAAEGAGSAGPSLLLIHSDDAAAAGQAADAPALAQATSALAQAAALTVIDAGSIAALPAGAARALISRHAGLCVTDAAFATALAPRWLDAAASGQPLFLISEDSRIVNAARLGHLFTAIIPANADADLVAVILSRLSAESAVPIAPSAPQKLAVSGQQVLIADDNATNCRLLETILTTAGHEVTRVSDGDQALDQLAERRFDLALFDVNMPGLSGIEACRLWRASEGGRSRLPILGLTADATAETERACLAAGMDRRLTKPIDAALLLAIVAEQGEAAARAANVDAGAAFDDVVIALHGTTALPAAAIFDPAHLRYLESLGGEGFLHLLLTDYAADARQAMAGIHDAVACGDPEAYRFSAHALKSSSRNAGASALAERCERLERITESRFRRHGRDLAANLDAAVARALAEITAITATAPVAATG